MRYTSPNRSTRGHGRKVAGVHTVAKTITRIDVTVPEGTPDSRKCHCGANVPVLKNGRLLAHAAGGTKPNIRRGEYKCEGSGVT